MDIAASVTIGRATSLLSTFTRVQKPRRELHTLQHSFIPRTPPRPALLSNSLDLETLATARVVHCPFHGPTGISLLVLLIPLLAPAPTHCAQQNCLQNFPPPHLLYHLGRRHRSRKCPSSRFHQRIGIHSGLRFRPPPWR